MIFIENSVRKGRKPRYPFTEKIYSIEG